MKDSSAAEFLYMEYRLRLANNIEHRMDELEMSGRELARRVGCDPRIVHRTLRGDTVPSLKTICHFLAALELDDISELFKDRG